MENAQIADEGHPIKETKLIVSKPIFTSKIPKKTHSTILPTTNIIIGNTTVGELSSNTKDQVQPNYRVLL